MKRQVFCVFIIPVVYEVLGTIGGLPSRSPPPYSSSSSSSSVAVVSALSSIDPILHFGAGAVAGGVGAIAAYPFDYIKSQLQTPYGKQRWGTAPSTGEPADTEGGGGGGGGGLQCAWDTLREYGPQRFYKGVTVQVIGIAPEKGLKLGVNDVLKQICLAQTGGQFPLWAQIIAGGTAGACQVLASSPLEVMKVGLQTSNKTKYEVWNDIGGPRGLFRGATACIVRDVLFTAVCFPLYAYWVEDCSVPTFFAGALSGVIASFVATPPDVIKTRILSQDERGTTTIVETINGLETQVNGNVESNTQRSLVRAPETVDLSIDNDSVGSVVISPALGGRIGPSTNSSLPWTDIYTDQDFANIGSRSGDGASSPSAAADQSSMSTPRSQDRDSNPWTVFLTVLKVEGVSVLFSGVTERCIGAVPRFGTTLAMHDYLEHVMDKAGWLTQTGLS